MQFYAPPAPLSPVVVGVALCTQSQLAAAAASSYYYRKPSMEPHRRGEHENEDDSSSSASSSSSIESSQQQQQNNQRSRVRAAESSPQHTPQPRRLRSSSSFDADPVSSAVSAFAAMGSPSEVHNNVDDDDDDDDDALSEDSDESADDAYDDDDDDDDDDEEEEEVTLLDSNDSADADADLEFAICHDCFDQDGEAGVTASNCIAEASLDDVDDDEDDTDEIRFEHVVTEVDNLDEVMNGPFALVFKALRGANKDDVMSLLKRAIVDVIQFEANLDVTKYTGAELEKELNEHRVAVGNAMKEALKQNGYEDLIPYINLGNKFSLSTLILCFLHYAPKGCVRDENDEFNYCVDNQCCIHTMKSKVPTFLTNENLHGWGKMLEWTHGGKCDFDWNSKVACLDLLPFLLDKKDSKAEMERQYEEVRKFFGLDSFYELMAISFCFMKLHIRLYEKVQEEKKEGASNKKNKFQVHVCSSFTAKYIFGYANGIEKYLNIYEMPHVTLSFGFHPQALLMGIMKNDFMYPQELRKLMSRILVRVFGVVCYFKPDFESRILDIFGNAYSAIDCGMYSLLSKLLDGLQLLSLDSMVETQLQGNENAATPAEVVEEILSNKGVNQVYVAFLVNELKTCSLHSIMTRMRRFRAAHRLPKLAVEIPPGCVTLDNLQDVGLQCLINAISSTLGKSSQYVFRALTRIKKAQEKLSSLNRLASFFNVSGDHENEKLAALMEHQDFTKLTTEHNLTSEEAIRQVKRCASAQEMNGERGGERLSSLNRLASFFNSAGSDEDEKQAALMEHQEFKQFIRDQNLTLEEAIRQVKRCASSHDRISDRNRLLNSLAKEYDGIEGNDDEKKAALVELTDFIRLIKDHNIGQEDAIKLIIDTAEAYVQTFWKHYKLLEEYHTQHGKHDIVEIEGVRIITIRGHRDDGNGGNYIALYGWVNTQNGYLNALRESGDRAYGFKAYQRPGSLEYQALVGLDVCFDHNSNKQAIQLRQTNDMAMTIDESGRRRQIMGGML